MGHYAAAVAVVLVMGTSPLYAQDTLSFVVTTMSADVHKAPSVGSAVVGKAPRGKALDVTREVGSWVGAAWPDAETGVGYLHVTWGTISRNDSTRERSIPERLPSRAAPSAGPSAPESDSQTAVHVTQVPRTTSLPRPAPGLPSHVIGLGGRMGTQAIGLAATGRVWTHGLLGAQIEVGRSTHTSTVGLEQVRSMQFAPSLVYSPPNVVTNAIWARPYVGAGITAYRSTLKNPFGVSGTPQSGLGSQVFGGAEFTWANVPQVALSADLRQQWAPAPFTGFELGGFAFSMSAHWYAR